MVWPTPNESSFEIAIMLAQVNAAMAVVNLIESPVPYTFPEVQIALSEGGIGWIPAQLERRDGMYERHRGWARKDGLKPSDVFRRNFYGAFVQVEVGVAFRNRIGVDRIMWECDYPHVEEPWPGSQGFGYSRNRNRYTSEVSPSISTGTLSISSTSSGPK